MLSFFRRKSILSSVDCVSPPSYTLKVEIERSPEMSVTVDRTGPQHGITIQKTIMDLNLNIVAYVTMVT